VANRGSFLVNLYLVVSTPLKNISQNGNLPQIGVKIKIFETTTEILMNLHFFIRHDLVAMKWSEGVPQPQVLQVIPSSPPATNQNQPPPCWERP